MRRVCVYHVPGAIVHSIFTEPWQVGCMVMSRLKVRKPNQKVDGVMEDTVCR